MINNEWRRWHLKKERICYKDCISFRYKEQKMMIRKGFGYYENYQLVYKHISIQQTKQMKKKRVTIALSYFSTNTSFSRVVDKYFRFDTLFIPFFIVFIPCLVFIHWVFHWTCSHPSDTVIRPYCFVSSAVECFFIKAPTVPKRCSYRASTSWFVSAGAVHCICINILRCLDRFTIN